MLNLNLREEIKEKEEFILKKIEFTRVSQNGSPEEEAFKLSCAQKATYLTRQQLELLYLEESRLTHAEHVTLHSEGSNWKEEDFATVRNRYDWQSQNQIKALMPEYWVERSPVGVEMLYGIMDAPGAEILGGVMPLPSFLTFDSIRCQDDVYLNVGAYGARKEKWELIMSIRPSDTWTYLEHYLPLVLRPNKRYANNRVVRGTELFSAPARSFTKLGFVEDDTPILGIDPDSVFDNEGCEWVYIKTKFLSGWTYKGKVSQYHPICSKGEVTLFRELEKTICGVTGYGLVDHEKQALVAFLLELIAENAQQHFQKAFLANE